MSRSITRIVVLLVGLGGLAFLPASPSQAATPSWSVMSTGSLGDGSWMSLQATDAGLTGISDRTAYVANSYDSEYWHQVGGVFKRTRIPGPHGGYVDLDAGYGVSKSGRVVYVSGTPKGGNPSLYRSTDHGARFTKIAETGSTCGISSVTTNASGATVAYSSCGAMRYSSNGGASFVPVTVNGTLQMRAFGTNQVLVAASQGATTKLWLYDGATLWPYGDRIDGGTLSGTLITNGMSISDNGDIVTFQMATGATLVSDNGGGNTTQVAGVSSASSAVVSRDGSDVYVADGYDVFRVTAAAAHVYGNARDRVLSLPSHPEVGLLATSGNGGKLYASAYKSGTYDNRRDYLLETKYATPAMRTTMKIIGKARVGRTLKVRKPVPAAGHYTCTVSWKAGKAHVSNKTTVRVKRTWRHKQMTATVTCRSTSHANFTRKKSVRVR